MADQSFQDRLDRLGKLRDSEGPAHPKPRLPEPTSRDTGGWFRWKRFIPSVVWGGVAHITVLFANMHYEQAKSDYEAFPQMLYIILGCAAFGLLSYFIVVLLLFRALAGRPTLFSVVLGFFVGVAAISLM